MAISSGYDYDRLLSMDRAKLETRTRENGLGTQELILSYRLQNSGAKQDCLEYLETNRLTLTDPTFSFKTYEGTWKCISISFNEDNNVIVQRFQIDSSLTNDVSQKTSEGVTQERSYYWRVTNPDDYNVPTTVNAGEVYSKTANDNGDGTYDVIITKNTAQNFTGNSYVQAGAPSIDAPTQIVVSDAGTTAVNSTYAKTGEFAGKDYYTDGTYYILWSTVAGGTWYITDALGLGSNLFYNIQSTADVPPSGGWNAGDGDAPAPTLSDNGETSAGGYTETSVTYTSSEELSFASDGGTIADSTVGKIKRIDNVPLEDGKFRSTVTTRTAIAQRKYISWLSDYSVGDGGRMVVGRNQTFEDFQTDANNLTNVYVNSVSFSINDYGLVDYVLKSAL